VRNPFTSQRGSDEFPVLRCLPVSRSLNVSIWSSWMGSRANPAYGLRRGASGGVCCEH